MEFAPEPVVGRLCARADQVERALKAHSHDAIILQPHGKDLDLVSIILPDNNGSLYGDLKPICETDFGLVSQCCLAKHVFRMSKQCLANVALKIKCKGWREKHSFLWMPCQDAYLFSSIAAVVSCFSRLARGDKVGVMLRENALNPTGFAGSFLFPVKELLDKSLSKLHSTVPPPAYNAHLAAVRAQFYMEQEASDGGSMASRPAGQGFPVGLPSSLSRHASKEKNVKSVVYHLLLSDVPPHVRKS
ncbi:hypothetical protein OPV22_024801 [Ensete ventricosum]|uniref:Piwi domain-containing protein n=1 Tax=Ensete ventricosum TaxID=4639 RepID=A0AAV8QAV0_ENSVE|nr:hypothetical protein OPV22_024801 [Ensete ventricosum]